MQQQQLNFAEAPPIHSVSQLVHRVRVQLETEFRNLWVQGEISNFRVPPSGHYYFTLKDADAQIRCVCFRLQSRYLKFRPEDGMKVLARGSISVYAPRGEFQLMVEWLEPVGRGALQVAFERLKKSLSEEGLFDPARKKKLPVLPRRIGVVTSPSGAAIQDILNVLERRNDRVNVLIFPVRVQGEGAAAEIARGVQYFNTRNDLDVLIVGRGGGSLEDLWPFNEEVVARALAASRIPVISAVGHEIDFTIADFVADLRAPTPSAAAEIVAAGREELVSRVTHQEKRLRQAVRLLLQQKRARFHRLATNRAFVDAESRLRYFLQRLDDLQGRLVRTLPHRFGPLREGVDRCEKELSQQARYLLQSLRQTVGALSRQLDAYSPLAVLERGYAIVTSPENQIVRDPAQIAEGGLFRVRVARGGFWGRKEPQQEQ